MHPKILDLVQRNCLIFRRLIVLWLVTLQNKHMNNAKLYFIFLYDTYFRVSPERTKAHLPAWNSTHWINHNSHKRLLIVLIGHLRGHINTRQPTTIARMAVVPTNRVLFTPNLITQHKITNSAIAWVVYWVPVWRKLYTSSCTRTPGLERSHAFLCLRPAERMSPSRTWCSHPLCPTADPLLPACRLISHALPS